MMRNGPPERSRTTGTATRDAAWPATITPPALLAPFMLLALLALLMVAASGCGVVARHGVAARTPHDPATPWTPPKGAPPPAAPAETAADAGTRLADELPPELLASKESWTLEDIVDLALRNNPETKATWMAARAAAANFGSEKGAYYPQISGNANYSKTKSSFSSQLSIERTSYEAGLSLNLLLFDFGKREADVDDARHAMYRANFAHNAMIQDVVLEVERAYYQYLYAKALRDADSLAVREASANLDAAEERRRAGLATVSDVLQARANLAQKRLALETVRGRVETIRGSLATAMGLSPNLAYDVGMLPERAPMRDVDETVEALIAEAQRHRPDLAAARAASLSSKAHARSVRAEGWPEISVDASASRRYYDNPDNFADNHAEGVFLTVPLFTGFSQTGDVEEARSLAEEAKEDYETLRGRVELEVWTAYYGVKTAAARLESAADFLRSADESHEVALGRYQAGVGTILELLAAQSSLEDARAQDLLARTDWLLSLAELAHATGRLGVSTSTGDDRR